jgi:hypothetical protein
MRKHGFASATIAGEDLSVLVMRSKSLMKLSSV